MAVLLILEEYDDNVIVRKIPRIGREELEPVQRLANVPWQLCLRLPARDERRSQDAHDQGHVRAEAADPSNWSGKGELRCRSH